MLSLTLLGCRETAHNQERVEAVNFDRLLTQLREADSRGKAPLLPAVRELPCSAPQLCELKQVCVTAYEQHVSAVTRMDGIRAQLETPDAGLPPISAPAASGAAYELTLAQQELTQSRDASAHCAELQAAIRERYQLR